MTSLYDADTHPDPAAPDQLGDVFSVPDTIVCVDTLQMQHWWAVAMRQTVSSTRCCSAHSTG